MEARIEALELKLEVMNQVHNLLIELLISQDAGTRERVLEGIRIICMVPELRGNLHPEAVERIKQMRFGLMSMPSQDLVDAVHSSPLRSVDPS